jgi:hypothetical protein
MAQENDLPWATVEMLTAGVAEFLNPVLAGGGGTWEPAAWRWA